MQQLPGTAALLATSAGNGYFHWLVDALPRLEILRKALPNELGNIQKFVVNKGISIIKESLETLNIPLDKLLFIDSRQHIQFETLLVPSIPGVASIPRVNNQFPAWGFDFLRENFLPCKANINPIPRLYISRSKARYRRVQNEEAVIQCLSKFGFTPVWLEEYDFATQIALFSGAEVIISPHGAGLTNLIWCNLGTKVLEVFSPNYVNPCFWTIANQVGLEYFYIIGKGRRPPNLCDPYLVQDCIEVPIEELEQGLEKLLK